jgi:hypothetical protein
LAFLLSSHLLRHPPLLVQVPSSDFLPSKIAKEFVGWMKSGPKDIEDLREEYELMGWRLYFWRQRPEHVANDLYR